MLALDMYVVVSLGGFNLHLPNDKDLFICLLEHKILFDERFSYFKKRLKPTLA